jgi:hypothetical protein
MNCPLRMAARAVGSEIGASFQVENRFRHDRSRGIPCAQEEDVVVFPHRDSFHANDATFRSRLTTRFRTGQRLKPNSFSILYGTAEDAAEKL